VKFLGIPTADYPAKATFCDVYDPLKVWRTQAEQSEPQKLLVLVPHLKQRRNSMIDFAIPPEVVHRRQRSVFARNYSQQPASGTLPATL
jgi:hypothetical protein